MSKTRPNYRNVEVRVWNDEKFRALSAPKPNAQTLWLYLLTGPFTGVFPGIFPFSILETSERFKWRAASIVQLLDELVSSGMVRHDQDHRLILLPNATRANPPANPNVAVAWGKNLQEFPRCTLRDEAYESALATMKGLGEPFTKGFLKGFGKGLPETDTDTKTDTNTPLPPGGGWSLSRGGGESRDDDEQASRRRALEAARAYAKKAANE